MMLAGFRTLPVFSKGGGGGMTVSLSPNALSDTIMYEYWSMTIVQLRDAASIYAAGV